MIYKSWVRYRWHCLLVHIIGTWPRVLAYRLFSWAKERDHTLTDGFCFACHVAARIKHDKHDETDGPRSVYCAKCGLDKAVWPMYCANHVVKVNNRERRATNAWHKLFWMGE